MPLYEHDCHRANCCVFVCSTNQDDVYLYNKNSSVLVRHSNEPSDYSAYPPHQQTPPHIRAMILNQNRK